MEIIHSLKQVAELLQSLDNIIISAHIGPDGDAIGSISALLLALKKMNKNVFAFLEPFPDKFRNIPGANLIRSKLDKDIKYQVFIALDCAEKSRLGSFVKYFDDAEITINIDHHISNANYAMFNYVDTKASATAEIIYNLIDSECTGKVFELDKDISSALYAGILSDTGGFRHPSTTSYTYSVASRLIENGADFCAIYNRLFNTKKIEELRIMSLAVDNIRRCYDNRLVWTSVTSDELAGVGAELSDLDSVVDFVKSVQGSKIAVFYYQNRDGEFKASFRSVPEIDVNVIAGKFGGGGHKNAAGCTFCTSLEEAFDAVAKEIETELGWFD